VRNNHVTGSYHYVSLEEKSNEYMYAINSQIFNLRPQDGRTCIEKSKEQNKKIEQGGRMMIYT